jgi:hypothetical protein
MERTNLGNKRLEGIAAGPGASMFTTELFFGGVKKVDVVTGVIEQVVPSFGYFERAAVGISYYQGALFVAGAGPFIGVGASLYVYDAETGTEIAACTPDFAAVLLNDVTVLNGKAYLTDSFVNKIMVVDADAALNGECIVESIDLPEFFISDDSIRTNGMFGYDACVCVYLLELLTIHLLLLYEGVVGYGDNIIITDFIGGLYLVDLSSDINAVTMIVGPEDTESADGILVDGDILYAVQNSFNQIGAFDLTTGELVEVISSPYFDNPGTVAMYEGYLFAVNTRLNTVPFPAPTEGFSNFTETFDMVRVPKL